MKNLNQRAAAAQINSNNG